MNSEILCSQPVKGEGRGMEARNELRVTLKRSRVWRRNQEWNLTFKEGNLEDIVASLSLESLDLTTPK